MAQAVESSLRQQARLRADDFVAVAQAFLRF